MSSGRNFTKKNQFSVFSAISAVILFLLLACAMPGMAGEKKNPAYADPQKVDDPDFLVQGEYSGEITSGGEKTKTGAQVIALGDGRFRVVGYTGGLPGDGWEKPKKETADGETKDGVTTFVNPKWVAKIKDGTITVTSPEGEEMGTLKRVSRESPTLGLKPPEGAVVLFDGSGVDKFEKGARMTEDKLLMEGANSSVKYQSVTLHLEFRLPYMPFARGQGRGNSGCYLQGRYETQILDSFGLEGKNNECGGIYTISDPDQNMCFPPLAWQTYDIDYTVAKFEDGKKVKNAVMTVKHNGVAVQKDVELTKGTTSAPVKEGPEPGHLHLQNHGNPVRFRNIWYVEKK